MPAPDPSPVALRDIESLIAILAVLRAPESGCVWDLAQDHASLSRYAVEEAYEVADAIARGDLDDLRDELGDLLLQVVFHARLALESGAFDFGDVVEAITGKMVRRHPHIFGAKEARNEAAAIVSNWDRIKADERAAKGRTGTRLLDDVPLALPGLSRAVKLQKKASTVGFDWENPRLVLAKIREEVDEIAEALDQPASTRDAAVAGEIGDLLFAVANLARHANVDPETAVRGTNAKFERRFAFIEDKLAARGSSPRASTLEAMDALWTEAKSEGL